MGLATIPFAVADASTNTVWLMVAQLGGAFGTAVLAVILEAATSGATDLTGLANGFDTAFWWAVGFTVVAVGVCLALPGRVKPVAAEAPIPVSSTR